MKNNKGVAAALPAHFVLSPIDGRLVLEEGARRVPKLDMKSMSLAEIEAALAGLGQPPFRARQVFRWLHRRAVCDFGEMTDLPADLRARLRAEADPACAAVVRRQEAPKDGTVKLLLRFGDGETVEAVLLRYRFGHTVCISTQAGCRMGCVFCASTVGGLARNLTAGEMVEEVLAANRELRLRTGDPEARVSRVVLMGIGEPLENYEAVVAFLRLIHDPAGLAMSYRHVTLSTCGLVPEIRRLAGEGLPITLAVSLHAPNDELRDRLMPVNRRYPLRELLPACAEYGERTGRRVTFEYALIEGVNDAPELARELARLLKGMLGHVNLIPLNPSGRGLGGSPPERVEAFRAALERAGIAVTVRRELGTGIDAACGQLRRRSESSGRGLPAAVAGRVQE